MNYLRSVFLGNVHFFETRVEWCVMSAMMKDFEGWLAGPDEMGMIWQGYVGMEENEF
jgi:hypothetical protein